MAQALHTRPVVGVRHLTVAAVAAWFVAALVGSLLGAFDSEPRPPIPLGLAAVAPVVLFGLAYWKSPGFRQFVSSLDLRLLTVAQTWRVGAVVFLVLYYRGLLPGVFALPAGWGDIAIGATAPILAWYWRPPFPYKTFVVWNVLGLLDLVTAVSLGILASGPAVGVLAGDVTTRLMGLFPLSLVPTFFVPLLAIMHLISLGRAREKIA